MKQLTLSWSGQRTCPGGGSPRISPGHRLSLAAEADNARTDGQPGRPVQSGESPLEFDERPMAKCCSSCGRGGRLIWTGPGEERRWMHRSCFEDVDRLEEALEHAWRGEDP